jgi:hypothetical protein
MKRASLNEIDAPGAPRDPGQIPAPGHDRL